jgi:hypothetical protein
MPAMGLMISPMVFILYYASFNILPSALALTAEFRLENHKS